MIKTIKQYFSETFDFNSATLSGCIDIIAVKQPDGSIKSSSFHARFGKFKVLKTKDRIVSIHINGVLQNVQMKLGKGGEAYFEEQRDKKDIRKISEDFIQSESEFEFQSPSEDEDYNISPRGEMTKQEEQELEEKQKKELQKLEKMLFTENNLSPKANKGIVQSMKGFFKNNKNQDQQENNKTQEQQENSSQQKINISSKKEDQDQNKKSQQNSVQKKYKLSDDLRELANKNNNSNSQQEITIDIQESTPKKSEQKKFQELQEQKKFQENKDIEGDEEGDEDDLQQQKTQNQIQNSDKVDQQNKNEAENQQSSNENLKNEELQKENVDEDEEEEYDEDDDHIELSLCGNLIKSTDVDVSEKFESKKVKYEEFVQDPLKILLNKNLLIRIKDELYTYELAVSMLICNQAFKKELPFETKKKMSKKKQGFFSKLFTFKESPKMQPLEAKLLPADQQQLDIKNDNLQQSSQKLIQSQKQLDKSENNNNNFKLDNQIQQMGQNYVLEPKSDQKDMNQSNNSQKAPNLLRKTASQDLATFQAEQKIEEENPNSGNDENDDNKSICSEQSQQNTLTRIRKTFKPKSKILETFNLKNGRNVITYTVNTKQQGNQTLEGCIYLYDSQDKIVISDIDGTITQSDVLGQLMPMVDKQWVHDSVVKLYNNIYNNGYKILYLTARAIGQSEQTRNFINSVEQDGKKLPEGPVIMSPDRVLKSFTREVIHKKPEVFKIVALRDISSSFKTVNSSPYYSGFGNRETDATAYKAVGVSTGRIFIINPDGQLFQYNNTYKKTYKELAEMSNVMFPHIDKKQEFLEDRFNNSNFWSKLNPYSNCDIDTLLEQQ